MKKVLLLAGLFVGLCSMNNAKAQAFEQGSSSVQIGYGAGTFTKAIFSVWDIYDDFSYSQLGPMYLKYEYGVSDKIGFGLNVAYTSASAKYSIPTLFVGTTTVPYEQEISWYNMSFNARMNIHFGNNDKFDPYWGIGVGYRTGGWKFEDNDPSYDNNISAKSLMIIGFETTLGARYYFNDFIGAYAEMGLAKSVFQGGLTLKF